MVKKQMDEIDETAITEIMIQPDGRIYVFGLSREVAGILETLCPEDHPLLQSLVLSDARPGPYRTHEPKSTSAE